MEEVLKLVVMGRACRNAANIKNRQPIGQMFVKAEFDLSTSMQNRRRVECEGSEVHRGCERLYYYSFKPQMRTVGPKYEAIGRNQECTYDFRWQCYYGCLECRRKDCIRGKCKSVELLTEDLLIDTAQMEGYVSENDNGITVVLDMNLSEALLEEGLVEIIGKIQTMRKEADFEVMDKITVTYKGTDKIEDI